MVLGSAAATLASCDGHTEGTDVCGHDGCEGREEDREICGNFLPTPTRLPSDLHMGTLGLNYIY